MKWPKILGNIIVIAGFLILAFIFANEANDNNPVNSDLLTRTEPIRTPAQEAESATLPAKNVVDFAAQVQELKNTVQCYKTGTCPFSEEDPRAYDIAVGKSLQTQLERIRENFISKKAYHKKLRRLANEMFYHDDGYVQEAALNILRDLPPDSSSLKTLTVALADSANPLMLEKSMDEMKRYLGRSEEKWIHKFLQNYLQQGAHFGSQSVASKIYPFINGSTYPIYQQTWQKMKKPSKAADSLRAALDEYQRKIRGG